MNSETSVTKAAVAPEWDDHVDFVVVGSGAAGLTAALFAADAGASVIILEKSDLIGGTAALSGGVQWIPMNHHMHEVGVTDSREEALEYLRACASATNDDEILEALVDLGAPMVAGLEALGVRPGRPWPSVGGTNDYRAWLPGAKHGGRPLQPDKFPTAELGEWAQRLRIGTAWSIDLIDYYAGRMHLLPPQPDRASLSVRADGSAFAEIPEYVACGTALVGELLKACLARGVRPVLETPGRELVLEEGRVVGIVAERKGAPWRVGARRGVLLATGGYGTNSELVRNWMRKPLLTTAEIQENQGDGHLMGMAAGAQVAGLGDAWWMPHIHVGVDDAGALKNIARSREDRALPHTIVVNRRGQRFINESINYYDFADAFGSPSGGAPRNWPAWLIFDQQGAERYAMLAARVPLGETPEWLTTGDSIMSIATQLGIDAEALTQTVDRFNSFARTGVDEDFHRGEDPWDLGWGDPENVPNPCLGTVEKAPYYAVEVLPGALATSGGLRVNAHGQVRSAQAPFDPIPGLYAAGNCSNGGPIGSYPGAGATIGAAMTFGYAVGKQIAAGDGEEVTL
jgi:3-oxosteroid 1-dehydrogenase